MFRVHDVVAGLVKQSSNLMEVTPEIREELHQTLLEMLKDIHEICERVGIEYALVGGSALGAVRHLGFIPWDDDLDIGMLRADFEHFKDVFEELLGDRYVLEAPNYKDVDSKAVFGKIYKKGTSLLEIFDVNTPFNKGIYVDIFIFDNVSPRFFIREMDGFLSSCLRGVITSVFMYKYRNQYLVDYFSVSRKSKAFYRARQVIGFLFSFISHKKLVNIFDSLVSRRFTSQYITVPTGRNMYKGEIIPKEWWRPLRKAKFESEMFYTLNNVEGYLSNMYGKDYMVLPPPEKRERHYIVKIDFGKDGSNQSC